MKSFLMILLTLFISQSVFSQQIQINLGEAKTKKSNLAIPALVYLGAPGSASNYNEVGATFYQNLTSALSVSSYFNLLPTSSYLEDTLKTGIKPLPEQGGFKFQSWKAINADFLIRVGFSILNGQLTVEANLYQVSQEKLILGKKYQGPTSQARRIAFLYANDILKSLTGKEGMFLSQFLFTSDRNSQDDHREVFKMDWDGDHLVQLTDHKTITLSPAWSPDAGKIAYTAYVKRIGAKFRNPDMLVYEIKSKKRYIVSYRQGMNSGAAFAPDNKHLYLTISNGKTPNIFKMTFDGTLVKQLTSGPLNAMNVEPSVSPDGQKIAFSSDRSGAPMIYIMNSDGSEVKRKTFVGRYNSSPAWSPDGLKIAFAGQTDDHYDIFIMDVETGNISKITSAKKANGRYASNEDPSFSPDGRFVVYTSDRTGSNQIYISTIDGSEERAITKDKHNYYKPRWSINID